MEDVDDHECQAGVLEDNLWSDLAYFSESEGRAIDSEANESEASDQSATAWAESHWDTDSGSFRSTEHSAVSHWPTEVAETYDAPKNRSNEWVSLPEICDIDFTGSSSSDFVRDSIDLINVACLVSNPVSDVVVEGTDKKSRYDQTCDKARDDVEHARILHGLHHMLEGRVLSLFECLTSVEVIHNLYKSKNKL